MKAPRIFRITGDGSHQLTRDPGNPRAGKTGVGGWAAVVEEVDGKTWLATGSEHGRHVTSSWTEKLAPAEGLASIRLPLPAGSRVFLRTDLRSLARMIQGKFPSLRAGTKNYGDLGVVLRLVREIERLSSYAEVRSEWLEEASKDPSHRLAHDLANQARITHMRRMGLEPIQGRGRI